MPYLVDGNNLAHALGLSRSGLADRDACLQIVAAFCRSRGAQATVVFDGPPPNGAKASSHLHRVRVVFSEAKSADELILGLLKDSVSLGVTVERCHEFARRLDRKPEGSGEGSEKPAGKETPEQIEAWLAVFSTRR
jgi:hypothetical protein